jgi:hypothetical protein
MNQTALLAGCSLMLALLSGPARFSAAASHVGSIPACDASQLTITAAGGSAGVGHVGVQFQLRNRSAQGCRLIGYATTLLLDDARHPLATSLRWGSGYLAGQQPVRSVELVGAKMAYFVVEWVHIPTPGQSCLPARYLLILPPATAAAQLVSLTPGTVTACGGQLTISPVEASPFGGF